MLSISHWLAQFKSGYEPRHEHDEYFQVSAVYLTRT